MRRYSRAWCDRVAGGAIGETGEPAPHVRADGTAARPLGTLGEQLSRAVEPLQPPLSWAQRERLLITARSHPRWARALARALGDAGGGN